MTEEQFNRLPKYAQEEIEHLRRATKNLLERLKYERIVVEGSPNGAVISYSDELRPDNVVRSLSALERVEFPVPGIMSGNRNHISARLNLDHRSFGPAVEIMGSDSIEVHPSSGNLVYIKLQRRP